MCCRVSIACDSSHITYICLMPPPPIDARGIEQLGCASVHPSVCLSVCEAVFPPSYARNEWSYFNETYTNYPVDIKKITGSKVTVRQRWPENSCELDSSWTTEGI